MNNLKFGPEYSNKSTENYTITDIERAIKEGDILEAVVSSCDSNMALCLSIGEGIKGKIEFSELEYRLDNKAVKPITAMSKVGRHVKFIPVSICGNADTGYTVNCSRKLAQKECYKHYLSKIIPGTVVDVRVIATKAFGVFCDVGCGVMALLPTNLISVTHIDDPTNLFKNTPNIKAIVKNVQMDGKVQLSHRELLGTWSQEVEKLNIGSTVCGTVISVEDYGVFVKVTQNISGLASVNCLDDNNPDIKPGDIVSVKVRAVSQKPGKSGRVKLNIIEKIDTATEEIKFNYYGIDEISDCIGEYGDEYKDTCLYGEKYIKKWDYLPNSAKPIVSDFESESNELRDYNFKE